MSKSWFVPLNRNSSWSSGAKGETDTEVHDLNYKMEMEIEIWKSRGLVRPIWRFQGGFLKDKMPNDSLECEEESAG